MQIILSLLLGIIFGCLCAYIASKRGRSVGTWFVLGLLFGIISLIIILILPRIQPSAESETPALLTDQDKQDIEEKSSYEIYQNQSVLKNADWFYLDASRTQIGPISFANLEIAWNERTIEPETYVWREGMPNWQKIQDLPDLNEVLSSPLS